METSKIGHWLTNLGEMGANLRLRSKFLLSIVVIIAGLTCGMLLVVRATVQQQAHRQMERDAQNALLMFEVMQQQRLELMNRKADLLATLVFLRNGDVTTIEDAIRDPWQSEDCDLFALADHKGRIVALKTRSQEPADASRDAALQGQLRESNRQSWWYSGRHIYLVVVKPYYEDPPKNRVLLGALVLGREMDTDRLKELSRISSSEIVFRLGNKIVLSSLSPFEEVELAEELGKGETPEQLTVHKRNYLARTMKLTPGQQPGFELTVLKSDDEAMGALKTLNHVFLSLGLIAVLAGAALVYVIANTITRPLGTLVEGVQALEQGKYGYPLRANGGDEVARVTRAFENLRSTLQSNESERHQLEEQLRQSQKMDALGRLAGGVAHDFNNLLTVIKGNVDLAMERMNATDPIHGNCSQIRKVADRAAALTRQLLTFSRRQVVQPLILDLNDQIVEMSKLLKRLVREDIEFSVRLGESLGRVQADPGQLEQVLLNLTVNACDAMPQGGKLTIGTQNLYVDEEYARSHAPLEPGDYVVLEVADTGIGMDAITKARIFEPFFTTKDLGKGTGLGLATVYGVVKQSAGFIWVETAEGKGTRFEIYLPQAAERQEANVTKVAKSSSRRGRHTVLVVEDEEDVRALTCEFLQSAGYQVLTAQDGEEAIEVGKRLGGAIDLVLTDLVMPRMRGLELSRRLKQVLPDMKVMYMSGYIEECTVPAEIWEAASLLEKPFSREELLQRVAATLAKKPQEPATVSVI